MIELLGFLIFVTLAAVFGLVTMTLQRSVSGYANGNGNIMISDDNGITGNPTVPAAQPVATFTHTTNSTGSMVMANSNHGIITGQRIDIYWPGGQCYGAVAGTVAGTTVPIASVSGGSNLPATNTTGVVVGICTSAPFDVIGNNLQALVMIAQQQGYFVFNDGTNDDYAALVNAAGMASWAVGDAGSNPLATYTITKVFVSHSFVTGSVTGNLAAAVVH